MAGFNLARKNKMLQEHKLTKNLNALNERVITKDEEKEGSNKPSSQGFDLSFTPGKTYNLDEIEANKNRQSNAPLIIEVDSKIDLNGSISISSDNSEKIRPNANDFKTYLLDD